MYTEFEYFNIGLCLSTLSLRTNLVTKNNQWPVAKSLVLPSRVTYCNVSCENYELVNMTIYLVIFFFFFLCVFNQISMQSQKTTSVLIQSKQPWFATNHCWQYILKHYLISPLGYKIKHNSLLKYVYQCNPLRDWSIMTKLINTHSTFTRITLLAFTVSKHFSYIIKVFLNWRAMTQK